MKKIERAIEDAERAGDLPSQIRAAELLLRAQTFANDQAAKGVSASGTPQTNGAEEKIPFSLMAEIMRNGVAQDAADRAAGRVCERCGQIWKAKPMKENDASISN